MRSKALQLLAASALIVTAAWGYPGELRDGEANTAGGARAWLERLADFEPDAESNCRATSALFATSVRYFGSPAVDSEFVRFATEGDTLRSWIARSRAAKTPDQREQLLTQMTGSSHLCVRCQAVQRRSVAYSEIAPYTQEERGLRRTWDALRLKNERFVSAARSGDDARIRVETESLRGYFVYFQRVEDHWQFVCRDGYWIF